MILRRIADGIRNQDWFVVMIEIMIVVVGIFIGLQVDDWNTSRQDRDEERIFLVRLHEELLNSVNVRRFLHEQRIEDGETLLNVLDTIFIDTDQNNLTVRECTAIHRSFIKTANIGAMPSFNALMSTGRIHIVQDGALKVALIRFEQHRNTLQDFVDIPSINLSSKYPDIIALIPIVEENGNLEAQATCDLQALRGNQGFLNDLVTNADKFEAYMTSGFMPIVNSIEPLHSLLDNNLSVIHTVDGAQ